jgi:hypothetical protein
MAARSGKSRQLWIVRRLLESFLFALAIAAYMAAARIVNTIDLNQAAHNFSTSRSFFLR